MALMVDAVVTTLICASAHRLADHDGLLATHRRRAQLQEEGINSGKLFTNNRRMSLTSVLSPMDFSNWVNCKAHLCHVIVKVFKIPLRVFFQSHLLFCDEDVLTKHIRRSPAPSLFSNVLAVTCAGMVWICGVPGALRWRRSCWAWRRWRHHRPIASSPAYRWWRHQRWLCSR